MTWKRCLHKSSIEKKYFDAIIRIRSPIAQPVEQVAVNHWVVGSSPTRGASLDVLPNL